jgi:hypothetical protein
MSDPWEQIESEAKLLISPITTLGAELWQEMAKQHAAKPKLELPPASVSPPEVVAILKSSERLPTKNGRDQFQSDLEAFERRARADKLSPAEGAKLYAQLGRLYKTHTTSAMMLTEQIMHLAACPSDVHQGKNPTCVTAALENRIYSKCPSEAANFVIDAFLNDNVAAADGRKISLNPQKLIPDVDARAISPEDGQRDYANQIFQEGATTLNRAMLHKNASTDSGKEIEKLYNAITGQHDSNFVLSHSLRNGTVRVSGTDELQKAMMSLFENAKLPALIEVRGDAFSGEKLIHRHAGMGAAGNSPLADSTNGLVRSIQVPQQIKEHTGDSGYGWHLCVVRNYRVVNGQMEMFIDDQYRCADDRWISAAELLTAMTPVKGSAREH